MARSNVGRVSGNERIDTSAMPEPDADTELTKQLWLEEIQDDPDFHSEIKERIDRWKTIIGQAMDVSKLDIHLIGESHIDVAWLWRYEQTRKKAMVTFKKAVEHARMFPGKFTYALSEPILLEWVKQDYPDLFKDIQDAVKKGQIELVGGSYVEPDCMMPSGEAFVRQRLYGMRFYRDNFGVLPEVEWFLDSFGYNYGLPQILVKSGAKYFWTSKITWNLQTTFPFVNFWWQGPDGTRLLTSNFQMGPGPLDSWVRFEVGRHPLKPGGRKVWDYTMDYDDLGDHVIDEEICPVVGNFAGKGDGGHGPTHQETAEFNEYDRTGFMHWSTVKSFFSTLETWSDRFPVWNDELYLENHRGTFSVHAEVKRHNRYFENALASMEVLSSIASIAVAGFSYPADRLERAWKTVLKGQFHDVLPGSSIPEVYDDAMDDWDENDGIIESIKQDVSNALPCIEQKVVNNQRSASLFLLNPVSWDRKGRVFIPASIFKDPVAIDPAGRPPPAVLTTSGREGHECMAQPVAAEDHGGIDPRPAGWWAIVPLAATSVTPATLVISSTGAAARGSFDATPTGIKNSGVSLKVDQKTGAIMELRVKGIHGGNNLLEGSTSNLTAGYKDQSRDWPAWNLTPRYWEFPLDLPNDKDVRVEVTDAGPVFSTISVMRTLGSSPVVQKITLFEGMNEVFLEWIADWNQPNALLKVAYHTATGADTVVSDIAYGAITRSTCPKVPCDKARYEKVCHKYADLSTPDNAWGIAMLNEGKYAFDTDGSTIRLTMLRSPEYPGPAGEAFVHKERAARKEKHGTTPPKYSGLGPFKCRYALLPHQGGALVTHDGNPNPVVKKGAEEFNQPVISIPAGRIPSINESGLFRGEPLLSMTPGNVMVGAVKVKEWNQGKGYVIRVHEACGMEADVTMTLHPDLAWALKRVKCTDLLERDIGTPVRWDVAAMTISFHIGRHEICTFEIDV